MVQFCSILPFISVGGDWQPHVFMYVFHVYTVQRHWSESCFVKVHVIEMPAGPRNACSACALSESSWRRVTADDCSYMYTSYNSEVMWVYRYIPLYVSGGSGDRCGQWLQVLPQRFQIGAKKL